MKLIINGEQKEFEDELTLGEVLRELGLVDKVMAAAVNMEIVKQKEWDSYPMRSDDKLELLDFVGGG
ncbi:sulfur carrier protein ThiS [Sulfurimonas sp.]|uniref:sulfur carrier protein ThiS n=1 Tax=Sulfurimonas sp. TaxID=2022749 RepID=UPI0025CC0088|nr:sulfur carrier protein ThiS [Sulfurimonas sp.]MDD5156803.1 sulfur carrier protein ThiS [Sulfurimonas sp.]